MYCPKCAAPNLEDAKFCRGCGTNLSLVPQALTGSLPEARKIKRQKKDREEPPSIQGGIVSGFMGLGFIIVAATLMLTGEGWGIWMLIPGFIMMGKGVASIVAVKYGEPRNSSPPPIVMSQAARNTGDMAPYPAPSELAPPSVTEGTTRILEPASGTLKEKV